MKKLAEWISIKKIAVAVGFAFFASMVPNWLLAFIARPSGDDYGYSAASHQTWLHTHSVIEVLRTGLETTKQMCQVWNGDWFSVFIFTLMPEVFVYRSFWIVPVFWTLAMIAATYYMVHEVFTNYFGLKWYEGGMVTLLILLMFYQWIPSSAIGMYWYVAPCFGNAFDWIFTEIFKNGQIQIYYLFCFGNDRNRRKQLLFGISGFIQLCIDVCDREK